MESQDEQNPACSSSNPASIESESQRATQANEDTDEAPPNKMMRLSSKAWSHFHVVTINGIRYGDCKYCNTRIKSNHKCGTTSLHAHYNRCLKKPRSTTNEGGSEGDNGGQQYFDQDVSRRELAHAIILHEYPLSIVDHVGFRKFVASLQPLFKMVSRNTIKNDILKIFDNFKSKTCKLMAEITSRIAITTDMWTSDNTKKGFMAITAHFIDDSWRLQSHILRFIHVPAPHDRNALCSTLLDCLFEWNLERRISTITVDNSSTNNAMMKILLDEKLCKRDLLLMGKLFHVRCAAHILNLIVQEGLKEIEGSISNVRASVLYWIGSPGRIERFEEAARVLHISCKKKLEYDCPTRWNSTYLMLTTALEYKKVFMKLESTETNFKSFPTKEEWIAVKEVSDKLKIFYQTTEYFSGSHYPTSCEYFAKVCDIKLELEAWVKSLNPLISSMASTMLSKFKKYWDDVHILMGVAAIFDPRYKMKLVEFNLERIYGEEASTKIQEVLTNCNDMFQEYKTRATSFDTSFSSEGNDVVEHDRLSSFDRYVALSRANVETRSELDLYLEESLIPRTPHFDNLSWWKTNGLKFPTLQRMSSSSSTTSSAALLGCESRKRAPSQLSDPIHVHHPGSSSNKRPASASAPSMAVKETPALALPPVPLFGLSIDAPLLIPCDADEEQFDKKIKLNPLSELSPPPNPCLQNECSSHINEESKTIISHVKSVKSVLVYQLTCGSTKTVEDMVKCANNAFFNLDMLETDYTSFYKDVKDFITYQDELLTIKRQREMQSFLELKTRYEDAITCANDLKYEIIRIQGHLEMTMKKKELLERLIAEAVELIGRLKQCVASLEEGEDALEHICKKQISIAAHENAQHEVQKLLTQVEAANDVLREIDQRENEALDGIESTTRRLKSIQS